MKKDVPSTVFEAEWFRSGQNIHADGVRCLMCKERRVHQCGWVCLGCRRPICSRCKKQHAEEGCRVAVVVVEPPDYELSTKTDDEIATAIGRREFTHKRGRWKKIPCLPDDDEMVEIPGRYKMRVKKDMSAEFTICGLLPAKTIPIEDYIDSVTKRSCTTILKSQAVTQRSDGYANTSGNMLTDRECAALKSRDWLRISAAFGIKTSALDMGVEPLYYMKALHTTFPDDERYFAAWQYMVLTGCVQDLTLAERLALQSRVWPHIAHTFGLDASALPLSLVAHFERLHKKEPENVKYYAAWLELSAAL